MHIQLQQHSHLHSFGFSGFLAAMLSKRAIRTVRKKLWAGTLRLKLPRGNWKARAFPMFAIRPMRDHWAARRRRISEFCAEIKMLSVHPDGGRDIRAVADQIREEMQHWALEDHDFFSVCRSVDVPL